MKRVGGRESCGTSRRVLPLSEALESLYARVPLGMRLGLDAMREACARTGHPERAFEAVHVAGTNGKGSVSAMVESIARASGKKTGLFTSPHLSRFAERIRIDGEPVDDDTLRGLLGDALVREARVELAVIEVGLGGRLDATNVIPTPRAAAITRIAFDHTDRLGPTLLDIAREKAGIAKPGLEIVLGPVSGDVRAAIDSVAHEAGATTTLADDDEEAVRFVASARLGLPGAHQQDNARVAFLLGKRISADTSAIAKGLAVARWPGRLETLTLKDGPVLLDAAHNPDGIASLVAHLRGLAFPPDRVAIVFGVLADKEWAAMQDILADATSRRFYVAPKGRAAVSPEALRTRSPGEVASGVGEAIERARHAVGADGLVVVAGSIMLVGEARSLLLDLPRDPPVAL